MPVIVDSEPVFCSFDGGPSRFDEKDRRPPIQRDAGFSPHCRHKDWESHNRPEPVNDTTPSRRRFHRIRYTATVTLSYGGDRWQGRLVDISLNGLLMTLPAGWPGRVGDGRRYRIEIDIGEKDLNIVMQDTTVAHMDEHGIGLTCHRIDIDSIASLKRLIELNLGDAGLVHRELASLGEPPA